MATKKKATTKSKRTTVKAGGSKSNATTGKACTKESGVTAPKAARPERLSAIDAAEQVLAKAKAPMRCTDLITAMSAQGLWKSPNGKTPAATLYAAITKEIRTKRSAGRFKKVDRGQFALNGKRS